MIPLILSAWLSASPASAQAPGPDLHVVFHSEFDYMARVRTLTHDWWLGDRRSTFRQGDRLVITRRDLGISWRVDLKAGTYIETKLPPPAEPPPSPLSSPPAPVAPDMRTAGYDWEPGYDWQVAEAGGKTVIAGRPCRQYSATGSADYAEAQVTFWACEPVAGASHSPTDTVLSPLRSDSAKKMILDTIGADGKAWVLRVEETQEPAIAPTMVVRVSVESLEVMVAPAGSFDLPATVKRAMPGRHHLEGGGVAYRGQESGFGIQGGIPDSWLLIPDSCEHRCSCEVTR